jgi:DNA-binding NarL/FixJ family response regulator
MADNRLPLHTSSFIPFDAAWIEAMRLARNAVKEDIRAKGHRLKDYDAREIGQRAKALLAEQPAFIERAWANLLRERGPPIQPSQMARAKANGKRVGRPAIDPAMRSQIAKLAQEGATAYPIGKALGIDRKTAVRYASEAQRRVLVR